ncbi:MAG: methyltransferase family protein, partial [Paracoccaceae bacterium]
WTEGKALTLGLIGIFIAGLGAMVAFAAQMSMGTSWRVGVVTGETGSLISGGLYQFSRNPTFVGQFGLLAGVALAAPSMPTILAPILFLWSAIVQIRSEEVALRQTLGSDYDRYAASVPRWIGFRRRKMP